jgi:hypothetical protein
MACSPKPTSDLTIVSHNLRNAYTRGTFYGKWRHARRVIGDAQPDFILLQEVGQSIEELRVNGENYTIRKGDPKTTDFEIEIRGSEEKKARIPFMPRIFSKKISTAD